MFVEDGWDICNRDYVLSTTSNKRSFRYHNLKCRNCDEKGHLSKSCPLPKVSEHLHAFYCSNVTLISALYMYIYACSTYIWHDNAINIISHVFIGSNTAMLVQKLFHFQKEKKCGLCSEVHYKSRDKRHCPQTICLLCLQTGHSKASCYEARAIRKTFCKRCRQRGHQAKVSGNYMQQRL